MPDRQLCFDMKDAPYLDIEHYDHERVKE